MANFDLISTYTDDDAAWLREQGYPCPIVQQDNEMPTTADMKWALEAEEGLSFDYPIRSSEDELYGVDEEGSGFRIRGFDWDEERSIPGDYFTVYGTMTILSVLIRLCQRCGQLYVYPDSGAPAIILDASLDSGAVAELYAEAWEQQEAWAYFFEKMYGPDGLTKRESSHG
ncbi:MAG: hypothetical protein ACRELG_29870 [Gemmataceae bacterium]